MASPPNTPSWSIDGFDQLREIGRGGSSTVYAARQAGLGRQVAIKVVHVDLADDTARRRFERECAVLGALGEFPGIVPVYSAAFTSDGRGCIVMRLMRESLAQTLRRDGALDPARVRDVGVAACVGLGHAHAHDVVHRDVKPANLLVSAAGEVAIGDFDIASAGSMAASTVTIDSMSPPHAPPERLMGDGRSGAVGDVWSLGSTLYMLLEDRHPFGTANSPGGMAGLIQRVLHDPLPPLRRSDVPADLEAVLRRAMAKDPRDRWPDMASMGAALAAIDLPAVTPTAVAPAAEIPFSEIPVAQLASPRVAHGHRDSPRPVSGPVGALRSTTANAATVVVVALAVLAALAAAVFIAVR